MRKGEPVRLVHTFITVRQVFLVKTTIIKRDDKKIRKKLKISEIDNNNGKKDKRNPN